MFKFSTRSLANASSRLIAVHPIAPTARFTSARFASTAAEQPHTIDAAGQGSPKAVERTVVQKIGRATATGGYMLVVTAGVALCGIVFWALGSNLFFETRYLNEAVDLVKNNPEVKRLIGHDLNAYGERSRNGRRGGPVPSQRSADGHVYMIFHLESHGTGRYGTCRLDVKELPDGAYEIKQLYCDVPGESRIWIKQEKALAKAKRKLFSF